MQVLDPLAIGDIGLASRHIPYMLCVDEEHFEPACFQDLEQRDPVDTCRFHCHSPYSAGLQPLGEGVKIASERFERSNRFSRTVRGNGNEHLFSANINTGRVRVQDWQHPRATLAFAFRLLDLTHCRILLPEPAARGYDVSKLLSEIAAETTSSLTCP